MNKVAQYLNEHIVGEATSLKSIRKKFSVDGGLLEISPEIVVFPKNTNDIRKVARFTWQLAEKGHVLGLTTRGYGNDTTGAAIGKGIIINTSAHLGDIVHVGIKERLVHVQSGADLQLVNRVLNWQGLRLAFNPDIHTHATIGGALANNTSGLFDKIGATVKKLEVVLANGDLIETSRLSKRDVNKKKGLQTLEGEIYRQLDGLIDDNSELIEAIAKDTTSDHAGYRSIAKVREKDGSIDLTPLIVGSQGTLGIITEAVLQTDFYSKDRAVAVGIVGSKELARDIADSLRALQPTILEMYDGELFAQATAQGTPFKILGAHESTLQNGALIYIYFNDFSDRAQKHKIKKVTKIFAKNNIEMVTSDSTNLLEIENLRRVGSAIELTLGENETLPPVIDGSFIPAGRHEEFTVALGELADKLHVLLPAKTNLIDNTVSVYPTLRLSEVSDKQRLFKLMNEYSALVDKVDGAFIAENGEGRLKATSAWNLMDSETVALFEQVRRVFDPYSTLNPGVKQATEIKTIVGSLRDNFDNAHRYERGFLR